MANAIAQWLAVIFPISLLAGPAVAEVLSGLMSAIFLFRSARSHDWAWLKTPWLLLLFAMCAVFVVSGLFSADPALSAWRGFLYFRFPLFAAALSFWVLRDDRTQRRVLLSMVIAMTLLAADMLLEYVTGYDILGHRRIDVGGFVRLHGPFSKLHPGSTLIWLTFPAIFYLLNVVRENASSAMPRIAALLGIFLLFGAVIATVYISGERAAFLSSLLGIGLAIIMARRVRYFFVVVLLSGCLLLATLIQYRPEILTMQVTRVKTDVSNFWNSPYGRIWTSALKVAQDNPVLGVGAKQFRKVCPDPKYGSEGRDDPVIRCGMHPHNIYIELLAETGVISLLLFLSAIFCWCGIVWRQRTRVCSDILLCGMVVACIMRLWPIASTTSHFVPWFASPLWFVIALTLARLAMPLGYHEQKNGH